MRQKLIFISLFTVVLMTLIVLPVWFYWVSSGPFYGKETQREAPTFSLLNTANQPHSLSQHQGKFVFLYFGYLHCDDICHNQVGVMYNINNHTTNKDIDFIFVTMDPNRDSPTMLNDYFNQLGTNFTALTAKTMREIQKIAAAYNAPFFATGAVQSKRDYEIAHPGSLFLIDPNGQIRVVYQNQFLRYDKIINDLNMLRTVIKQNSLKNGVNHA